MAAVEFVFFFACRWVQERERDVTDHSSCLHSALKPSMCVVHSVVPYVILNPDCAPWPDALRLRETAQLLMYGCAGPMSLGCSFL